MRRLRGSGDARRAGEEQSGGEREEGALQELLVEMHGEGSGGRVEAGSNTRPTEIKTIDARSG